MLEKSNATPPLLSWQPLLSDGLYTPNICKDINDLGRKTKVNNTHYLKEILDKGFSNTYLS